MIRLCPLPALCTAVLLVLVSSHAAAQPLDRADIPPELREWVGWVLDGTQPPCTTVGDGDDTRCQWPAALALDLKAGGADFRFEVITETEDWVPLPGSADHWPLDVKVGAKAVVIEEGPGALPWLRLGAGAHAITGRFAWAAAPSQLQIPPDLATVQLRRGAGELPAQRPEPGQLLIPAHTVEDAAAAESDGAEADAEDAEATRLAGAPDSLELRVHRLVQDGNPVRVTTQLDLVVSGRQRELALGALHLEGTLPYAIDTNLSYRVDEAHNVFVQVAAGHHSLREHARVHGQGEVLRAPSRAAPWPSKEVWAFAPEPRVREVKLSGAPGIDASRTELPPDWRGHSSYQLGKGGSLKIETLRRGVTEDAASELHLTRAAFIGEDGARWYVRDWLSGQLSRAGRVDLTAGELGRLTRGGRDLVITQGPASGRPGVGVPSGSVAFEAEWRMDRGATLPAAGWSRPVRDTSLTVHVPRDRHLVHAYGADTLGSLWWEAWDTERIVLLLLIVAGFAFIGDRRAAAAALLGLLGLGSMTGEAGLWFVAVLLAATWMLQRSGNGMLRRASVIAWPMCALATLLVCLDAAHDGLSNPALDGQADGFARGEKGVMSAAVSEEEAAPPMERSQGQEGGISPMPASPMMAREQTRAPDEPLRKKSVDKREHAAQAEDAPEALLDEEFPSGLGLGGLGQGGEGRGGGGADRHGNLPIAAPVAPMPAAAEVDAADDFDGADDSDVPAVAQTGFGMPVYSGATFVASWDGEVAGDQQLALWMVSTTQLRLLALLWIALLTFALWSLLRTGAERMRAALGASAGGNAEPPPPTAAAGTGPAAGAVALLLAVGTLLAAGPAHAAPSEELLEELAVRLRRQPDCASDCLSVSHLAAELRADTLTLTADVHAARQVALTVPGPADVWLPSSVRIDGKAARALALVGDHLTVRVPAGRHAVTMVGPVTGDGLTLQLGEVPHGGRVTAPGWDVSGVSGDSIAPQWSFARQQGSATAEPADPATTGAAQTADGGASAAARPVLPSWWRIQRDFRMDVRFRLQTRVERVGPVDRATTLKLPLLPDETITTLGIEQEDGHAILSFGPGQHALTVNSRLGRRDKLALRAEPDAPWTEIWTVTCSELWQCEGTGVPALSQGSSAVYAPWPGEKLDLVLLRPAAAKAPTMTIDDATLRVTQDARNQRATLQMSLRSALQSTVGIELPRGAVVRKLDVRGQPREVDATQHALEIVVPAGATALVLEFEVASEVGLGTRTPEVKVGGTVVNAVTTLSIQQDSNRRVLLANTSDGGDPLNEHWLSLVPWFLLSLLLSRMRGMPLGVGHFMLIGLADVFSNAPLGLALVAPLVLVTQRGALPLPTQGLRRLATVLVVLSAVLCAGVWSDGLGRVWDGWQHLGVSADRGFSRGAMPTAGMLTISAWQWKLLVLGWLAAVGLMLASRRQRFIDAMTRGGLWTSPQSPASQAAIAEVAEVAEVADAAASDGEDREDDSES